MSSFSNAFHGVLENGRPRALFDKLFNKVVERQTKAQRAEIRGWCEEHSEEYSILARQTDPALWDEVQQFSAEYRERNRRVLASSIITFGGAAAYDLLYFLVRLRQPRVVVETGVAAGWSSAAILRALAANGTGQLWSSDFPYIRQREAKAHIGALVDAQDRANWTLFVDGDRRNLPKILGQAGEVNLFHYDSDKSYSGRTFAFRAVRPYLAPDALIMFDDIQDNAHFRDLVGELGRPFHVFRMHKKFLGLIAPQGSPFAA